VLDQVGHEEWMPFLRQWRASRADCSRIWYLEDFYPVIARPVVAGAGSTNGHTSEVAALELSLPAVQTESA
ncbi:MAG TPA: hypothetical protein VGL99_01415, partial [Chloroflexota bacterium]